MRFAPAKCFGPDLAPNRGLSGKRRPLGRNGAEVADPRISANQPFKRAAPRGLSASGDDFENRA